MDDKELEIREAEVETAESVPEAGGINYNLIFLCAVSLLLGLAIKTEFAKRYTIGFDDGMIRSGKDAINLGRLEKEMAEKQKKAQEEAAKLQQQELEQQGGGVVAPEDDLEE